MSALNSPAPLWLPVLIGVAFVCYVLWREFGNSRQLSKVKEQLAAMPVFSDAEVNLVKRKVDFERRISNLADDDRKTNERVDNIVASISDRAKLNDAIEARVTALENLTQGDAGARSIKNTPIKP